MKNQLLSAIEARWNSRTKPVGSLGRLEDLAKDYCVIKGEVLPRLEQMALFLYAANHGVTEEGVSLYPREVTAQMVANFEAGGAAVNVLAKLHGIEVRVIDAGVAEGTRNFAKVPAMTIEQRDWQIEQGRNDAREAAQRFDLVGVGEMGIGNSTSAAAILAAMGGYGGVEVAGRGTGIDEKGVKHKAEIIDAAIELHSLRNAGALEILSSVGGFEIARLAGFLMEAGRLRLPVMLDGFITGAAALIAIGVEPSCREVFFYSHKSAERGHGLMLEQLDGDPILELGMRLGEGSGAILGMHLIRCAFGLYRDMASFESAHVSRSDS